VSKDNAFSVFKRLAKIIQNEKNCTMIAIKADHRGEFQNERFEKFCKRFNIQHNFSTPRT